MPELTRKEKDILDVAEDVIQKKLRKRNKRTKGNGGESKCGKTEQIWKSYTGITDMIRRFDTTVFGAHGRARN